MENNQIKVDVFNFGKNWNLVEPHLNDPEILDLLNMGMLEFSIYHGWKDLPLWNPNDDIGPWQYASSDAHATYASDKANDSPEYAALRETYSNICENEGIEFESIFYAEDQEDPKVFKIFNDYWADLNKIIDKYWPQKNTYRWYQCFRAGCYLKKWQLALAKKVFPDYEWRVFEKQNADSNSVAITHIGKGPDHNYLIFDICLFDEYFADEILESVGLSRDKLEDEWVAGNNQDSAPEAVYLN